MLRADAQPPCRAVARSQAHRLRRTTVLSLALLVLVGLPACALAGRAYARQHVFEAKNGQTLRFSATKGDRVWLRVKLHDTLDGEWAAPSGLSLTLKDNAPTPILRPTPVYWGDE